VPTGRVKWFDRKKGFGFIVGPVGQDVFVHYTHVVRVGFKFLKEGEQVRYHLLHTDKGWQARSVEPYDAPVPVADGADNRYEQAIVDEVPAVESGKPEQSVAATNADQPDAPRSGGYVGASGYAEAG